MQLQRSCCSTLRWLILFSYITTVLAGLLPVVFRGRYWLRIVCVAVLLFMSLMHLFFLDAEFRLVGDRAAAMNGGQWPTDYKMVRAAVREVSQSEVPSTVLLFLSFTLLAVVPYRRGSAT